MKKTYKYVDDQVNSSKVNMRKAKLLEEDGVFFKEIVDLRIQGLLSHIATRAEERGMLINAKKTSLMLVSAASSFQSRIQVNLGGDSIKGLSSLKILGVTLDSDASFKTCSQDAFQDMGLVETEKDRRLAGQSR